MRLAWDQRQGSASPVYVSDRLYIMQAGVSCLGSARDELIVRATCRLLQNTGKYKVSGGACHRGAVMAPFAQAKDEMMAKSGRFWSDMSAEEAAMVLEPDDLSALFGQGAAQRQKYLQARARSEKPLDLPEAVRQGVSKAVAKVGVVQPLPANPDILRALKRGATGSVVKGKISTWLQSDDGLKWQQERKELMRAGDCADSADEAEPEA